MSRPSLNRPRHPRAVWDRTTTDTRLLPSSLPIPVSLRTPLDPLRMSIIASAPSRPSSPQRHCGVDARVHSPRMITHGSYPMRACPTTMDARALSRMISRSAFIGVEADARAHPRMISRSAFIGVEADARAHPRMISRFTGVEADARAHPRMISRSALTGVEADACAYPQMISRAPALDAAARTAEGALATIILTLSHFRHSCGAGIHPLPFTPLSAN